MPDLDDSGIETPEKDLDTIGDKLYHSRKDDNAADIENPQYHGADND